MSRPRSPEGRCRDCNAQVFWAEMPNGKMRPFNRDPDGRGNVVLFKKPDGSLRGEIVARGAQPAGPVRRCHFDTCAARQHQQKGGGRQQGQQGRPAPDGAHGALISIVLCYADGTQLRVRPQAVHEVLPADRGNQQQAV